jgi:alkylhydroperoxidase family enzyme
MWRAPHAESAEVSAASAAAEHFTSEELAALIYAIVTINGWNRLAISTHMVLED